MNNLTRKELKELLPFMQAFAEGKIIQYKNSRGVWVETDCPLWSNYTEYRIKPESKYRPFKNQEECWQEMHKHPDFGWVKKISGHRNFLYIMELYSTGIVINDVDNFGGFKNLIKTYDFAFAKTTFADGTPFGIKEEL